MSDPTPTPASKWQPSRLLRVLVRVLRTYLQALLGFLTFVQLGNIAPGTDIPRPADAGSALVLALYASLFPALYALIMNLVEELNHLDPGITSRG